MNILSIDTTTKVASVAISKNDEILENSISNEITHSEKLLPLIDETLKNANMQLNDIDMYAVINGPGSFTGIRIGLATLKAFSMIDNLKIFSLSSTLLISYSAYMKNKDKIIENSNNSNNSNIAYVLSLIDARNDRVYYALNKLYINSENKIYIETIIDTSNDLIEDALKNISLNENDNLIISGNCINKFEEVLKNQFNTAIFYENYPTPSDLILAYKNIEFKDKYIYDTYTLDAIYARASQAERLQNNEK